MAACVLDFADGAVDEGQGAEAGFVGEGVGLWGEGELRDGAHPFGVEDACEARIPVLERLDHVLLNLVLPVRERCFREQTLPYVMGCLVESSRRWGMGPPE